jgi:FtsP/CotA-like multicopper oxidase with cupredoxin domain
MNAVKHTSVVTTTLAKPRVLLVLVAAALVALGGGATAPAAPVTINLCAVSGTAAVTSSVSVPIWGFALKGAAPSCSAVATPATLPGPQLSVQEGDVVTISVTNALPGTRTLTFEIPGITFVPGPTDAASGQTVTRTFTATSPGTYLYESGGDAGRQEAMGLYGSLIVRPPTPLQAYDSASTAYDVEAPLVLSQVDTNFNAAPDTFDLTNFHATYWLINGVAYESGSPGITATSGQRVLLRFLNAGYDNTSMGLLGVHEQVVARDAFLLKNPFLADVETIPAGATEDAIVTVPPGAPPSPHGFPIFNRNLHVTNGSGASYSGTGGMLTFIHP